MLLFVFEFIKAFIIAVHIFRSFTVGGGGGGPTEKILGVGGGGGGGGGGGARGASTE